MAPIPFISSLLELLLGIALLFSGGEIFVQGSVALSIILGIPQLVIGLTVVSLGTCAPEFFVSVISFIKGSDALAVSNVIGSNIFNVMVVLGLSALILPLKVESRLVRRDVPLLLGVSAAVWGMGSSGVFTWQAGAALLMALCINTIWEIRTAREIPIETQDAEPEIDIKKEAKSFTNAGGRIVIGIALLTIGSRLLVNGAGSIATSMGVSEAVVGLTIVSAGTSMPELMTSLVAALRGRTDLAIGNVVGSCLLNQLLVLGTCSLLSGNNGLHVEEALIYKDLPIMVITTLSCMPIFWTKGKISRTEGGILLSLYLLYLADQVLLISSPDFHQVYRDTIIYLILPLTLIFIIFKTLSYWTLKRKSLITNNPD